MLKEYLSAHGIEAVEKTNADRIRGMTDEELAEVIYKRIGGELTCGNLPQCKDDVDNDREIPDKRCIGCVLAWLRQPAGDGRP